jgi:PAS domain S-box-containing protein
MMNRKPRIRLSQTLSGQLTYWMVGLVILLGFLNLLSFVTIEYDDELQGNQVHMNEVIQIKSDFLEQWLKERAQDIRMIAEAYSVNEGIQSRTVEQMQRMLQGQPRFINVHYLNREGLIEFGTMKGASSVSFADKWFFREAMQGRESISEEYIGRLSGKPLMTFASPVRNGQGEVLGLILGDIELSALDDVLGTIHEDAEYETYVMNRDGYLITDTKYTKQMEKDRLLSSSAILTLRAPSELYYAALKNEGFTMAYDSFFGAQAYGAYRWMNEGKWLLVTEKRKFAVLKELYYQIGFMLLSTLCVLTAVISIIWVLTQRVLKPIQLLSDAATAFRSREYDHYIDLDQLKTSPTELRNLCLTYNLMVLQNQENFQALEESEQSYRSLFHYHPDITCSLDKDGTIQDINKSSDAIFGYTRNELMKTSFLNYIAEEERGKAQEAFMLTLTGCSQQFEVAAYDKDGGRLTLKITTIPMYIHGRVQGVNGIVKDITAERHAQAQLKKSTRELERSNRDLQQFAYAASHDLQEPLRMVTSYLQLLERRYKDKLDADASDFIKFAVDGAYRMQKLIRDLLDYSRVHTRHRGDDWVCLQDVVQVAVNNLQMTIQEKKASVIVNALPFVKGDETQLLLLIQNLLGNAVKFNDKTEPEIRVGAHQGAGRWSITVKDNGIGIASEHIDRIFTIFQRLHTQEEYPGTGIGLAMCKRIAECHEGTIEVYSETGSGSEFHVILPMERCGSDDQAEGT